MNTDFATLAFSGGGLDRLEVGGQHLGSLPQPGGAVTGNFAIGQLVVGQAGQVTNVMLADAIDNGHRNPTEALYLNGSSSANGLHILGGSTLALDHLDLYTMDSGQWIHVNDLFTGGKTVIAYDQGYISLLSAVPEPGTWAMWAAGLLTVAGRQANRRRQAASVRG